MDGTRLVTIEQIVQFLAANEAVRFTATGDDGERYAHISRVLKRFDYPQRNKQERGILRRYLQHTSGYSRAQITRLIEHWRNNRLAATPLAKRHGAPRKPFGRKYTAQDVTLLAEMDRAHEDICGPAMAHLLRRAWREYGDTR